MCDDTLDVAALRRDRAAGIPWDARIDGIALAVAWEARMAHVWIAQRLCYVYPITFADAFHVLLAARQDYQDAASAIWRTTDGKLLPLSWWVRLRAMAPVCPDAATIRRQWRAGVSRDSIVHALCGEWRGTAAEDARRTIDEAVIPVVLVAQGFDELPDLVGWFMALGPQPMGALPTPVQRTLIQLSGPTALRGGAARTTAFRVQEYLQHRYTLHGVKLNVS